MFLALATCSLEFRNFRVVGEGADGNFGSLSFQFHPSEGPLHTYSPGSFSFLFPSCAGHNLPQCLSISRFVKKKI